MANEIEALSGALANMDVAVVQRIYRFSSTFFTVISPQDVMSAADLADSIQSDVDGYNPTAIWQDIQGLAHLQSVEGNPISNTVEELQAQTVQKTVRARQIVDDTVRLIGEDLLTATFWLDVRHAQGPERSFGAAPTAAWTAFRRTVPFRQKPDERPPRPTGEIVRDFMLEHPASEFFAPLAKDIDAGP
jgi:histidine ammonia-lyase